MAMILDDKPKENKRTKETIYSIYSTKGKEFAILFLEKGLELKVKVPQREGSNQAHFQIKRGEKE